jgi:hypothetical protein
MGSRYLRDFWCYHRESMNEESESMNEESELVPRTKKNGNTLYQSIVETIMKDIAKGKKYDSTLLLIVCLLPYVALPLMESALANVYTLEWWQWILAMPLLYLAVPLGFAYLIYPMNYFTNKLKSWGMYEDKASNLVLTIWFILFIAWRIFL